MNGSTAVQLSVGESRSEKFSPSIVLFRNAGERPATSPSPRAERHGWMGQSR